MVRLPRPESAACAAHTGVPSIRREGCARIESCARALLAIIDGWSGPSSVRSSFLHVLSLLCPLFVSRTRLFRVYLLSSCAWVLL